jgi:hypothetical protein
MSTGIQRFPGSSSSFLYPALYPNRIGTRIRFSTWIQFVEPPSNTLARAMDVGGELQITGDKQLQKWLKVAETLPQSRRTKAITGTKGLYMRLHTSGSQDWLLRYTFGKPRVMLVGHYPEMGLSSARIETAKARVMLDQGKTHQKNAVRESSNRSPSFRRVWFR